jgi:hypothetical protein
VNKILYGMHTQSQINYETKIIENTILYELVYGGAWAVE